MPSDVKGKILRVVKPRMNVAAGELGDLMNGRRKRASVRERLSVDLRVDDLRAVQ